MPDAADLSRIRAESIAIVERFGLSVSAQLPLIEVPATRRSQEEILDRMLALHAVVASSFGFRNAKAIKWLEDQSLWDATSTVEKSLLRSKSNPFSCSIQREGLWAMFWALGYTQSLEFGEFCSETLADQLPNLKAAAVEDLAPLRARAQLRPIGELLPKLDLAYCLHHAWNQRIIERRLPPLGVREFVIVERRRALEWIMSRQDWDTVAMPT